MPAMASSVRRLEVTSTAGVGELAGSRRPRTTPLYRGTVSGTGEHIVPGECGGGWQLTTADAWRTSSDPISRSRSSAADSGSTEIGGARGYDETGSGISTVAPCHGLLGCSTDLFGPLTTHGVVRITAVGDIVFVHIEVGGLDHGDGCGPGLTLGTEASRAAWSAPTPSRWNSRSARSRNGTMTLTRVN